MRNWFFTVLAAKKIIIDHDDGQADYDHAL